MSSVQLLPTRQVEKVWGRTELPSPFDAPSGKRIGEIWFEPRPPCEGLLAKYLFTSEKLSVQVHPDNARAPEGSRGKEECWLVLDADPDARLAIGFQQEIDVDTMRGAALDGSIEQLLEWHPAKRGDFFYLPAGTVHAIGPGLSLVEIQQNSDITYRLYDYGRPRELHLDAALEVANGGAYSRKYRRKVDFARSERLVDGPYFALDLIAGGHWDLSTYEPTVPILLLPLTDGVVAKDQPVAAGDCAIVSPDCAIELSADAQVLAVQDLFNA